MSESRGIVSFQRRLSNIQSDDDDDDDDDNYIEDDDQRDIIEDVCVKDDFSLYSTFHGYSIRKAISGEPIKKGLRVIRRPVKPQTKTVIEGLGTILKVTNKGDVTVQWDKSSKLEVFKGLTGHNELLVYDNAQIGVKHKTVQCFGCRQYPLRGIRWKCMVCDQYDLCTKCYMNDKHDLPDHKFKRIQSKNAKGVQMNSRINENYIHIDGIVEGSTVELRNGDGQKGRVMELLHQKFEKFRSDAKVKWNDIEIIHPVGREGKCDLKFASKAPGQGLSYYEDHLPYLSPDTADIGLRVVRGPNWKDNDNDDGGPGYVGTIVNMVKNSANISRHRSVRHHSKPDQKDNLQVEVRWDNGLLRKYELQNDSYHLRIFDNGPTGVEHESYFCDVCTPKQKFYIDGIGKCIKGFRWQCLDCPDYDLCNKCYMNNEHDQAHKFERVIIANKRESMTITRNDSTRTPSHGIFKGAEVVELIPTNNEEKGTVMEICDCKLDIGRSQVEVHWHHGNGNNRYSFYELKAVDSIRSMSKIYHDHLPTLGKDARGYFEISFEFESRKVKTKKKIKLTIWRDSKQHSKESFKPSLYIIFAGQPEEENKQKDEDKMVEKEDDTMVDEIRAFARKTKLPCHIAGKNIMFYGGSSNSVFIHNKTDKGVIQGLAKQGFRQFELGDVKDGEDEVHYFIRMAEYALGVTVLPVIISLSKGGLRTCVMQSAAVSKIPILRMKKHTCDVTVMTPVKFTNKKKSVTMLEHVTDAKNPWSVQRSKTKVYDLGRYDNGVDPYEITFISEGPVDYKEKLDALVCFLIIGVSMESDPAKEKIYGEYTDMYPNALAMYLLKEGKWKIPKEHIKMWFNKRSIEYIYEQDLTSQFENGLWLNLCKETNKAYQPPAFIEKLDVPISELYGLIFLALLQNHYWNGATQLIETGCIRIHHILVGCFILDKVAKNWRTAPLIQERLNRLNKAFTQRAIRILSCIYEADKRKENEIAFQKRSQPNKTIDAKDEKDMELGDHMQHAGRLLLNHGYMEDAIKTKNRTFLDNRNMKNIINKMWYGREKLNYKTIVGFLALAACHIIILPLLMITMETPPLRWLYKKYKLPFMKVFIHMLGLLTLLVAYAYMLLFDYKEDGFSQSDYFIVTWMVSFFLDENKQHIVAITRKKWKSYVSDWWNRLDWLSMMVYTLGMLLKIGGKSYYHDASKVLLVIAFMLLCIRILNLFCVSEILGPKLVMIQKMFQDTLAFMIIMTVIMMCYNISFHALLYPNSAATWSQLEKITQNGFWMLFGELKLDEDTLTEPDCTFNKTIYEGGNFQRCPTPLGKHIAPYLKAFYGLIAVILLLNLLIAMYSYTFQTVQEKSEFYWSQLQNHFLEEFSIKTIFPVHLQLLVLPVTIVHALIWFCCPYLCGTLYEKCRREDDEIDGNDIDWYEDVGEDAILNHVPMFVRVFLYNTNFDLKLKTTREAEGNGALKARGEIDIMDTDRITKLHEKVNNNGIKLQELNEKNKKRCFKIMETLKEIKNGLAGKEMLKPRRKYLNYDKKSLFMLHDFSTSEEDDSDDLSSCSS